MAAPAHITLTSAQIAELCGGRADGAAVIQRVSDAEHATPDALLFAEDVQSLAAAVASQAGAILIAESLLRPSDPSIPDPDIPDPSIPDPGIPNSRFIRVANPRLSFARCAHALLPPRHGAEIHPSAVVDPAAKIGQRAVIRAGAVIEAGAVLGDDVMIASRATICKGVRLGDRVVVQAGAVLGSTGFGYIRDASTGEYILFPQQGDLIIEDDVEIGANTTIDRGALGETRIGRGTKIDNLVHIGHNCRIGRNVVIAAQVGISGSSVVEDGAILAGQVGISDHCHIGPGAILGGQAGVYRGKTINGAGEVFAGTPAEPLREHMRSLARLRRLK